MIVGRGLVKASSKKLRMLEGSLLGQYQVFPFPPCLLPKITSSITPIWGYLDNYPEEGTVRSKCIPNILFVDCKFYRIYAFVSQAAMVAHMGHFVNGEAGIIE